MERRYVEISHILVLSRIEVVVVLSDLYQARQVIIMSFYRGTRGAVMRVIAISMKLLLGITA